MDSFCGALKASAGANAVNANKGSIRTEGTHFWGERIKKNPKSRDLSARLRKNLRSCVKKAKPGVACSVLTSDVNKEIVDAKNKNVEHVLILSGDHLYRMNYMEFVQKHIDTNADVTVSCVPMDDRSLLVFSHLICLKFLYLNLALGNILFLLQQVDTTLLGLSKQEAKQFPYIASMGVYVFRTDVLLKLLRWSYPSCNEFGSEIIPSAVKDHNVQVSLLFKHRFIRMSFFYF
ncbi:hypothetical protein DKX38_029893 [Salix brachista]|uniref:glucose-1-phosphate adenylyltransferase n=1 Tax=Salix brachista TaxID=2182728 RepID=A0A5N5J548_9ROSI|nr:hypothetical protein DKX38_029893 [Salix brachista]